MLDCWKTNPAERPYFKQMDERFSEILKAMTDQEAVIQLDKDWDKSYAAYLTPI